MYDKLLEVGTVVEIPNSCIVRITGIKKTTTIDAHLECEIYHDFEDGRRFTSGPWYIRRDHNMSEYILHTENYWMLTVMRGYYVPNR